MPAFTTLTELKRLFHGVGAKIFFSHLTAGPDLMPLEEVFSKVKSVLKANDPSTSLPELFVKMAFCSVTQTDV